MAATGFYFVGLEKKEVNALRGRLNDLAELLGYKPERGRRAGKGSASMLLVALANADAAKVAEALRPVLNQ